MRIARKKLHPRKLRKTLAFLCLILTPAQSLPASHLSEAPNQGHILVFISSSMPPASLAQWFIEAEQFGAPLILRGLVNNSMSETKRWIKPFIEQAHNKGGIEINPIAFEAYGITQVPAVVVTTGTLECASNQTLAPPFDVITGNTSLSFALKIMAEKGEASLIAAQAVTRRRPD